MGAVEQVVGKHAKSIAGRYCYGIPTQPLADKYKLSLVEIGNTSLFEENDVPAALREAWLPLATLADADDCFLVVERASPHRVGVWDGVAKQVYPQWASIEAFAKSLLAKKSDKLPWSTAERTIEKASDLVDQDKYKEAIKLLAPLVAALPAVPDGCEWDDSDLSSVHNLYGLALEGTGKRDEARAAFALALRCGDQTAALNILAMLEDAGEWSQVVEQVARLRDTVPYFRAGERARLARYAANAHLVLGDVAAAERELRWIVEQFAISGREIVEEARKGLEEAIAAGKPGAAAARGFLDWLKPKSYEVTKEQAKANRAWWKSLDEEMQIYLLGQIGRDDGEDPKYATDEDIARALDVDDIDLEEDVQIDDVSIFLWFPRLTTLRFHGDPDTIEPLRTLPKLETLSINYDLVKDFAWPAKADRDLWKAAEAGSKARVEKALAAGASLSSRNGSGETALTIAASNHKLPLCKFLISKGADPWAGCHGEGGAFYYFSDDEKVVFEKLAAAAGIRHPDEDPWRVLGSKREPRAATLKWTGKLGLGGGERLAGQWPSKAVFEMEPPKKQDKLFDLVRERFGIYLVSERFADIVRGEPTVELLPAVIRGHDGKDRPEQYFHLNVLEVDCLDPARCYPSWDHHDDGTMSEVAALAIDETRVCGARIFRPAKLDDAPIVVAKELGEQLGKLTGVELDYPKR